MLIIIVVVIVIAVVLIPILLGLPPVFSPVPPLVILIPATLSFLIQIVSSGLGLAAVLTIPLDGSIQSRFRLFDRTLALLSMVVICARLRRCYQEPKRSRHHCRHCRPSKSSNQVVLLSFR